MNITEANAAARLLDALNGKPVDRLLLEDALCTLRSRAGAALQVSLDADPVDLARIYGCPTWGDLVTVGNGKTVWRVASVNDERLIILEPTTSYTGSSVTRDQWRRLTPVLDGEVS